MEAHVMARSAVALLAGLCALASNDALRAQKIPLVVPGWGVDTMSATWSQPRSPVAEIYRAWRQYLYSDPQLQTPTPLWSASEQRLWPGYDLTAGIAYKGFGATVLDIEPVAERPDEYIVKTLFASSGGQDNAIRPVALTRVYAVRQDGRWVFANALPRLTRTWQRTTVGPITYVLPPGRSLDTVRARRAVAFADSLATSFAVPRIDSLTYYIANGPEELNRIMGVDWTFAGTGRGYSIPWNRLILIGDTNFGEENRHELTHFVLSPLLAQRRTHSLVNEGIATLFGGSVGRTFPALRIEYAEYLQQHSHITLDSLFVSAGADRGSSPAAAILALMVHERAGIAGLKDLLLSGRSDEELRSALIRLLGLPWPDIVVRWRSTATNNVKAREQQQ
jgi:hypothetical protein